ncbi:glycine--tRNA ligase subunit beta [Prochlorococcus sp. MIT 1306]|uniref:glycine--tRNA ligase subunit beta n=1 Tax=Prochlorococcus sp. MIT 1306 TaxID=1799667 RepID=UPI0007B3A1D3|nr:glycine--tRNA ligase subunit beta [Prochlorococcus sp. MIT 1306]KZR64049.1 Glycine--tRNA ligase beta subunit [Prochlorococcus sp. MIT 1306]
MSTLLVEIGTEELPADFARLALPQLEQMVSRDLQGLRLSYGMLQCTSTPRRLVLLVEDLASATADLEEVRKGPPAGQAFKNGVPTQAAAGFAKRCGLKAEDLEIRETPKGPFVFATVLEHGRSAMELLTDQIPEWIGSLQGRRFMRWGEGERRFSRPIRWLVALLDEQIIPVCLDGSDPAICAANLSRGHRLHDQAVIIPSAGSYVKTLAEVGVEVDRQRRGTLIRHAIDTAAAGLEACPDCPDDLFEELTDLVEAPLLLEGAFAESYLDLPAEVLSTVMRVHQRYVPLYRLDAVKDPLALDAKSSLLPRFLCISNGLAKASDPVRRGNERVLKARLSDAEFFVEADRSLASIERRKKLAHVTFAEGLGSLLDRVERMEWLTDVLVELLDLSAEISVQVRRAVHLCKHDLVSQMVGEFPELQGVMGAKYLLAEGEPREVALAVLEHYLPRGAGDALPESESGAVLALADRLELLLSIYAKGDRPSGSSDPYALRRAGNGLLQILWSKGWRLNLLALLQRATNHWSKLLPHLKVTPSALAAELGEFLRQRMLSLLEEAGTDIDLAQAVAGETVLIDRLLSDPADARLRVDLLARMRRTGKLLAVQAVVTRAARLAEKGDLPATVLSAAEVVDPGLFEKPSELEMLKVLNALEPITKDSSSERYRHLADGLIAGSEALAAFFDGDQSVMVMSEDLAVRANRLNLLSLLRNQAGVLADFSQISG